MPYRTAPRMPVPRKPPTNWRLLLATALLARIPTLSNYRWFRRLEGGHWERYWFECEEHTQRFWRKRVGDNPADPSPCPCIRAMHVDRHECWAWNKDFTCVYCDTSLKPLRLGKALNLWVLPIEGAV